MMYMVYMCKWEIEHDVIGLIPKGYLKIGIIKPTQTTPKQYEPVSMLFSFFKNEIGSLAHNHITHTHTKNAHQQHNNKIHHKSLAHQKCFFFSIKTTK